MGRIPSRIHFRVKTQGEGRKQSCDSLSQVVATLNNVGISVVGFEQVKDAHSTCLDFSEIHSSILEGKPTNVDYLIWDGFLFKSS